MKFHRRTIKIVTGITCIFMIVSWLAFPGAARAAAIDIERISVDSSNIEGNNSSANPSLSFDGRYVAFSSFASNLVAGDTNACSDIFVHDRTSGTTIRVSVSSSGFQGNKLSFSPTISSDGLFVVFESDADNLVADDTNGTSDLFMRDLSTNTTSRISVDSSGFQVNDYSTHASISSDGRFVAFASPASNLVTGDTNGALDVFVRDLSTNTTSLVSVDSSGIHGNLRSDAPSISTNGRYVAFTSRATNLVVGDSNGTDDVFVHDRISGITTSVSIATSGYLGNSSSTGPSITPDGRFVSFSSFANDLVAGDTNGKADIFVRDLITNTTSRVSVDSSGAEGNNTSISSSLTSDGRYIVFSSDAGNLVEADTNGVTDIFVRDRTTNKTTRVSVDSNGVEGNNYSEAYSISLDGHFIAFSSYSDNLVPADTNNSRDIFIYKIIPPALPTPTPTDAPTITPTVTPSPTPTFSPTVTPATDALSILASADRLPNSGFAPGKVNNLPVQIHAFTSINNPTLEIPALGVEMTIVGVSRFGESWDITWLGDDAGYLAGSAYPTWAGNSVLTGHVWNANNKPGPFAQLKTLKYGDQINIIVSSKTYVYEVRENELVKPGDIQSVMKHEERSWVTLVTCESFDEESGTYLSRRMVKAILVKVK